MKQMGETAAEVGNFEVSISFGRFQNDFLSWERWSSFSQNKHMEEVEKCSTPGSVAKKKAYFEAHYKKVAAKKVEIEDQQKQVEASLFKTDESTIFPKKVETVNEYKKLEADLEVDEKPIGESPAVEEFDTVNQLKQVKLTLILEPEGPIPTQITQSVTSDFPPSDSQTDETIKTDTGTDGVLRNTISSAGKQESNLTSGTAENIVRQLKLETRVRDSPEFSEAATKVFSTNTKRNGTKAKKAPLSVMPKSPQISSLTPKKLTPKSTPSVTSTSQTLASRASKSSASSSKHTSAEHKKLAHRADTASPSPGLARSAPVTATRKTTFKEKMGDKDIVKRAFKSFQPNLNSIASPGERSDPLPKQVSRNTKEMELKEPLTSQKEKKWPPKNGLSSDNVSQATPLLARTRGDTTAHKGKAMNKVNRITNVKVPAGSHIAVKSKEVKETTTKDLKQSHKFTATPLPPKPHKQGEPQVPAPLTLLPEAKKSSRATHMNL